MQPTNDEEIKQILKNVDLETIDSAATYLLYNKRLGQPLSQIDKNTGYSRIFEGTVNEAIQLLKLRDDYEDFEILTEKQYFQVREAQLEAHRSSAKKSIDAPRVIPVDEIEYSDFLYIDIMPGISNRIIKFTTYLEWMMRDDFKALEERLKKGLSIREMPNRSEEEVIEGIVATSCKDFEKKSCNNNYYECNAVAIMSVMRYVFSKKLLPMLRAAEADEKIDFLVKNYQNLMLELLYNVEDICSLYSEKLGDKKYSSSIKKRYIHTAAVHQVLRQELYGRNSLHSFADIEISPSIGTIRQLIELRMRRAFGVLSYADQDGNTYPLNMNSLFNAIKRYEKSIELPLKRENILRIYTWANGYIHSGLGDYPWLPMYLERALLTLSFGKMKNDSWSVDNGIKTSKEIINRIQRDLLDEKNGTESRKGLYGLIEKFICHKRKSKIYQLKTCKPECEILG